MERVEGYAVKMTGYATINKNMYKIRYSDASTFACSCGRSTFNRLGGSIYHFKCVACQMQYFVEAVCQDNESPPTGERNDRSKPYALR